MKNYIKILLFFSFLLPLQLEAQTLQSYIEEAGANNPTIQAFDLRYKIAQEKVNRADWLPNTEFGFGYFVSRPATSQIFG
jgi:cobalt-zinc-cadmium efflux system outer membrane protein